MLANGRWQKGEPSLDELLEDAVMQAIMQRDGVERRELLALVERVRTTLPRRGIDQTREKIATAC